MGGATNEHYMNKGEACYGPIDILLVPQVGLPGLRRHIFWYVLYKTPPALLGRVYYNAHVRLSVCLSVHKIQ